jgi:hypothetical protein
LFSFPWVVGDTVGAALAWVGFGLLCFSPWVVGDTVGEALACVGFGLLCFSPWVVGSSVGLSVGAGGDVGASVGFLWWVGAGVGSWVTVGSDVVGDLVGKCQTGCGAGVFLWSSTTFVGLTDGAFEGGGVGPEGVGPSCARQVGGGDGAQVAPLPHELIAIPYPSSSIADADAVSSSPCPSWMRCCRAGSVEPGCGVSSFMALRVFLTAKGMAFASDSSVFALPKLLPPADGFEDTAITNATAPDDGLRRERERGGEIACVKWLVGWYCADDNAGGVGADCSLSVKTEAM